MSQHLKHRRFAFPVTNLLARLVHRRSLSPFHSTARPLGSHSRSPCGGCRIHPRTLSGSCCTRSCCPQRAGSCYRSRSGPTRLGLLSKCEWNWGSPLVAGLLSHNQTLRGLVQDRRQKKNAKGILTVNSYSLGPFLGLGVGTLKLEGRCCEWNQPCDSYIAHVISYFF